MTRVQIPAYTDRWAKGDRFGEVVKYSRVDSHKFAGIRAALLSDARTYGGRVEIAHVKLDKSGKTVRVILADCEVVS